MTHTPFHRTGDLKALSSYPLWLQEVVRATNPAKEQIVNHPLFAQMRDNTLPYPIIQRFLKGAWLTIERFPQFMAMNLQKMHFGDGTGADMARKYLMHNIRIEQKHADHWVAWAEASGLSLDDLRESADCTKARALAYWCATVCHEAPLAVGVAATNYAIEGVTGEWSSVVCSKDDYANGFPANVRGPAMRWLKIHAHYDDEHPWEALDIVATLLGDTPTDAEVRAIQTAIETSYAYFLLALEGSMEA
jgi:pyrroloquinoline quinone (PQQ) biosynthesis protein C